MTHLTHPIIVVGLTMFAVLVVCIAGFFGVLIFCDSRDKRRDRKADAE